MPGTAPRKNIDWRISFSNNGTNHHSHNQHHSHDQNHHDGDWWKITHLGQSRDPVHLAHPVIIAHSWSGDFYRHFYRMIIFIPDFTKPVVIFSVIFPSVATFTHLGQFFQNVFFNIDTKVSSSMKILHWDVRSNIDLISICDLNTLISYLDRVEQTFRIPRDVAHLKSTVFKLLGFIDEPLLSWDLIENKLWEVIPVNQKPDSSRLKTQSIDQTPQMVSWGLREL